MNSAKDHIGKKKMRQASNRSKPVGKKLELAKARNLVGVVLCFLGMGISDAIAQSMAIFPSCGKPGDSIEICGSGWAEPVPPCDYWFLLNGTEVTPRQPDGLFGPPNTFFTIPDIPPGNYPVLTELRLTKGGALIQAKQKTLEVVDKTEQPLSAALADSDHAIRITYDPDKACFNECTAIYFIQTRNTRRILDDGTNEHLPYNEAPHFWDNGGEIEATFVNDVAVDRVYSGQVPYYGIPPGAAQVGSKVPIGPSQPAWLYDRPQRPDSVYADNVNTIKINFEVNVFCGAGEMAGRWLGSRMTWMWSRDEGLDPETRGTVTIGAIEDGQPTGAFTAALDKWIELQPGLIPGNPRFDLPESPFEQCSNAF